MKMPKFTPKIGNNWGVTVNKFNEDCNLVHRINGKILRTQVRMVNTKFADGTTQSLYWPDNHEHVGVFKGMAAIVEE